MFEVDTLYVISSARGAYVLDDLLSALQWTTVGGKCFTVVVDETRSIESLSVAANYQLVRTELPDTAPVGFHRAAGLKWAIDAGIAYRQVIMLSDNCVITGQGLDSFFNTYTQKDGLGLIGVRSSRYLTKAWQDAQTQLFEWKLPVASWERHPPAVCDNVLIMAGRLVGALYQRNLLTPMGCETWPDSFGTYVSWLCHMLGFYVASWGYEQLTMPPLYVNNVATASLPSPRLLRDMLVFSPVDKVLSISEADIRERYKKDRGDTAARDIPPMQPVVTGPEQRELAE